MTQLQERKVKKILDSNLSRQSAVQLIASELGVDWSMAESIYDTHLGHTNRIEG